MTKVKIVLKSVTKSARLWDVFMDSHSTQEDVGNAVIDIFKALYASKGKFYHISSSKYLQHKTKIWKCKPFTKNLTKYTIFNEFPWQVNLFSWKSQIFLGDQFFHYKFTRLNILQPFKLHHNILSPYVRGRRFDGGNSVVGVSCELKCWTHLSQSSH